MDNYEELLKIGQEYISKEEIVKAAEKIVNPLNESHFQDEMSDDDYNILKIKVIQTLNDILGIKTQAIPDKNQLDELRLALKDPSLTVEEIKDELMQMDINRNGFLIFALPDNTLEIKLKPRSSNPFKSSLYDTDRFSSHERSVFSNRDKLNKYEGGI